MGTDKETELEWARIVLGKLWGAKPDGFINADFCEEWLRDSVRGQLSWQKATVLLTRLKKNGFLSVDKERKRHLYIFTERAISMAKKLTNGGGVPGAAALEDLKLLAAQEQNEDAAEVPPASANPGENQPEPARAPVEISRELQTALSDILAFHAIFSASGPNFNWARREFQCDVSIFGKGVQKRLEEEARSVPNTVRVRLQTWQSAMAGILPDYEALYAQCKEVSRRVRNSTLEKLIEIGLGVDEKKAQELKKCSPGDWYVKGSAIVEDALAKLKPRPAAPAFQPAPQPVVNVDEDLPQIPPLDPLDLADPSEVQAGEAYDPEQSFGHDSCSVRISALDRRVRELAGRIHEATRFDEEPVDEDEFLPDDSILLRDRLEEIEAILKDLAPSVELGKLAERVKEVERGRDSLQAQLVDLTQKFTLLQQEKENQKEEEAKASAKATEKPKEATDVPPKAEAAAEKPPEGVKDAKGKSSATAMPPKNPDPVIDVPFERMGRRSWKRYALYVVGGTAAFFAAVYVTSWAADKFFRSQDTVQSQPVQTGEEVAVSDAFSQQLEVLLQSAKKLNREEE